MASIRIKIVSPGKDDDLIEKKDKKKNCTKGNPFHSKSGTWSSKSDAASWSIRTGGTDCEHGQLRQNPRRWLKRDCGRKHKDSPNIKAPYKCKTGKPIEEDAVPFNCKTVDINKTIKEPKKDEPEKMEIEKKFDCDVKNIEVQDKKANVINRVRNYEKNFKGGKIWVSKEVFNDYLKFVDEKIKDTPVQEVDKHGNLNANEYRDKIFPSWRQYLSLGKGVY